jgi:hypothetical protein
MTNRLARLAAVAAAAFLIPACHDRHDHGEEPDIDLTIANLGPATVHAEIEFFNSNTGHMETAAFDVLSGGTFNLEIFERWADILIVRLPDGHVVYNETLEWHDFHDDDATVTVFP